MDIDRVILLGATGEHGRAIHTKLMEDFEVYTWQRNPHDTDDLEHWCNADLMEPQQSVTVMHQLWNDHAKDGVELLTPPFQAVVMAAGSSNYEDHGNLTTFDLAHGMRLHVLEPLMVLKYLIEFGLLDYKGKVVWLLDDRPHTQWNVPQRVAKAAMRPAIVAFSDVLPGSLEHCFVQAQRANQLGATADVAKATHKFLKGE